MSYKLTLNRKIKMAIISRYTIKTPVVYSVRGIGSEKKAAELLAVCATATRPAILIESEALSLNMRVLNPSVIICSGFKPSRSFIKSLKRKK